LEFIMNGGDDDSYEDEMNSEEQMKVETKKRKVAPNTSKKGGRPPNKEKYIFNQRDKDIMVTAVKRYGNSYAVIAKEYFSDCVPTVTRADIANFVNSNPHLKKHCQQEKTEGNKEQSLFPVPHGDGGCVIAPNINFLATPPFVVKQPDKYVYFYRLHLAQDLDVDYDCDKKLLRFEIISNPSLLPFESEVTNLYLSNPTFQALDSEEKLKSICHIKVPEDARLDDTIQRFDHDTEIGALIEVHITRKKEEDKSKLKGNRYRHMNVNVATKKALQHHPEGNDQKGMKTNERNEDK